ncbi:LssY C-terminal domain-containing protein [Hoeflea alexandrii]|uniref:bifunctional DedA family/phosphatase PAP2 family protein n=1 Tax=Hoeflea alexandrii TaxID=288436 RepID=UPI00226D6E79|nr:bifunctional DedA family/phosphatase PAP2 family protein [Hoeflea alexandrii]MCY0150935.1 LssY C-terminal domain-containing protein [Hoeflea alexandrii]
MPLSLDQLLPSLQALGVWTYWILGLFALMEAIVFTGIVVPGMIAVIAGGMLVERGVLDFFDLGWFIFVGTILGSEVSFRLGGLAEGGLRRQQAYADSKHVIRAKALLARYGGFALVVGRFFGPLSAFVPFTAAMAGMPHRRFMSWNLVSAIPYAFGLPAAGYFFGSAISTLGAAAPRVLAFGSIILVGLAILWFVIVRLQRSLPLLAMILQSTVSGLAQTRLVERIRARHPQAASFLAARFETGRFWGLSATVLAVLFLYLMGAYVDSVYDFIGSTEVTQADQRVANLLYAMRDTRLISFFGWVTAFGGWEVILPLVAGATVGLLILRQSALATGLWIVILGNQASVTILKVLFDRERSPLGYFAETSGSFPSGHAAASVAIWGMLLFIAWRIRLLPTTVAMLAAATVVCAIGLSRVYLIEHYVSDVVNGYIVGGLWLVIGISFCQWWSSRKETGNHSRPANRIATVAYGSMGAGLAVALTLASLFSDPVNQSAENSGIRTLDLAHLSSSAVSLRTESLTGVPRQPISMVIEAPDAGALSATMQKAGWVLAPRPDLLTLSKALWADWVGGSLPQPLVISTFWQARPNSLGFAKVSNDGSDQPRSHVRIWAVPTKKGSQGTAYLASVSVEDPLEWTLGDEENSPQFDTMSKASAARLVETLELQGLRAKLSR